MADIKYREVHRKQEAERARRWRTNHPKRAKASRARRYVKSRNESIAYSTVWNAEHAERRADILRRYYQRNKDKFRARKAVQKAIRAGILIKPLYCAYCERERSLEAHHKDYSKPLDVIWLCAECHGRIHRGCTNG
jgi:hypothetical protein